MFKQVNRNLLVASVSTVFLVCKLKVPRTPTRYSGMVKVWTIFWLAKFADVSSEYPSSQPANGYQHSVSHREL